MNGFAISLDEVRSLCTRIEAETDDIGRYADDLVGGAGRTAFGGDAATAASYAEFQAALGDSLRAVRACGVRLAGQLADTFTEYQRVEEANHGRF